MFRGNGRRSIVPDDADRQRRCEWPAGRRFGYRTQEIAEALGYRGHGGTVSAIHRVEATGENLRRTLHRTRGKLEGRFVND